MTEQLKDINVNLTEEQLIEFAEKATWDINLTSEKRALYVAYAMDLLKFKQQKELLADQVKFNEKMIGTNKDLVKYTKYLVFATWGLAIVTLIISFI